jgi:hypothetical protein
MENFFMETSHRAGNPSRLPGIQPRTPAVNAKKTQLPQKAIAA